jgi:membrane protease YdiL (CAAX protease family)
MPDTPRAKIALFLTLTATFSALAYWRMFSPGHVAGTADILILMWCPGVAGLLTRLITQRNLAGEGWKPWPPGPLLLGYALPMFYAGPVYLVAWLSGLAGFDTGGWSASGGLVFLATMGVLQSLLGATGEELGWRGLLVPELAKVTNFRGTALISGAIWAVWHMPLIIFAGYHGAGTPLLYSIACFAIMVVGLGTLMAWLRLGSGSVWPCALLHATHNLFIQGVFDAATVDRGGAAWLTGEFGAGLAVMALLFGWWALRRGDQVAKLGSSR